VGEIADRVILIDPNDLEYPPALNLFDFGLKRLIGTVCLSGRCYITVPSPSTSLFLVRF
jgi:hypothetical protein